MDWLKLASLSWGDSIDSAHLISAQHYRWKNILISGGQTSSVDWRIRELPPGLARCDNINISSRHQSPPVSRTATVARGENRPTRLSLYQLGLIVLSLQTPQLNTRIRYKGSQASTVLVPQPWELVGLCDTWFLTLLWKMTTNMAL